MMDIELMHEYEQRGLQFPDMALLLQLLVDRDWIWKLPAEYQREAILHRLWEVHDRSPDDMKTIWLQKIRAVQRSIGVK
jgi:hypothetical protein